MTRDESKPDVQGATGVSKTAIWVAAARAIGALEPDPATRNPDHLNGCASKSGTWPIGSPRPS
jgi:hypothetical protein